MARIGIEQDITGHGQGGLGGGEVVATAEPQRSGWTRRDFFNGVLNTVTGIIAVLAAIRVRPAIRPLGAAQSAPVWMDLGFAAQLRQTSCEAGTGGIGSVVKARFRDLGDGAPGYAYVRYIGGANAFFVLSPICTHLGCHVNWIGAAQQFHCPCHGSVYTVEGLNVSGPAPAPLGVFRWKLVGDHIFIAHEATFTHAPLPSGASPKRIG